MNLNRRSFVAGLIAALAAPAVIPAGSLMPLRGVKLLLPPALELRLISESRGIDIACPEEVLAGLDAVTPPDLLRHMSMMACHAPRIDHAYAPDLRFEATDRVSQYMQLQAIRSRNALVELTDPTPYRVPITFRGIPVEVVA
jgi:hypothetical protein